MSDIYAVVITETGEVLERKTLNKYLKIKDVEGNFRYRCHIGPRKLYSSRGHAEAGFTHISQDLKPLCSIGRFSLVELVIEGADLSQKQADKKIKRKEEQAAKWRQWKLEQAQRALAAAQKEIENLKEQH